MVDMVVHRHDLKPTLARLCRLLTRAPAVEVAPRVLPEQIAVAPDAVPAPQA